MSWYVAQLKPAGLHSAVINLRRQGIEIFSPMLTREKLVRGKVTSAVVPLFPGYIFVTIKAEEEYRRINSTLGIRRLVSNAAGPAMYSPRGLPFGFIEGLQAGCDADGVLRKRDSMSPGDRVLVIGGPFSGLIAELLAKPSAGRVQVLLDLLGRHVRSEIPETQLDVVATGSNSNRSVLKP